MRILVVSDSHGKADDIKRVLEQVGDIDMFIHLGDIESGVDYVRDLANCETHMVSGNCDYGVDLPWFDEFTIADKNVFITHGHRFHVGYDLGQLKEFAIDNGFDVVMFGHTHVPYLEIGDEVTVLNPGSISYPRQEDRQCTYALIDVDREGELHYSHGVLQSSKEKFYQEFF